MSWELSEFGRQVGSGSGIGDLMDDLGHALVRGAGRIKMLGGGQPAHIPEMEAVWRERMEEVMAKPGELEHVLGNYEPPSGNQKLRESLVMLFRGEFGWDVTAENIGITAGGQTAFFFLFNAFAGRFVDGTTRKVLLPLMPEYIGYANQSVGVEMFRAFPPKIEKTGEHEFKYRVDFENLEVADDVAAICVSRPTNPSGNVLTDNEIKHLAELAKEHDIPLIIDNAYGAPFPGVLFNETTPIWDENLILTMSLSKLGLPATRTGIVVARPDVIKALSSMTSIIGLANPNIGQAIVQPLVESGEILRLSREVVKPFYLERSHQAQAWLAEFFPDDFPYYVHRSEGALFLWLWFPELTITSKELYERLKQREVLVVPGEFFFYGLPDEDWDHSKQCLRVSYAMPEETVREGLQILVEEVVDLHRAI